MDHMVNIVDKHTVLVNPPDYFPIRYHDVSIENWLTSKGEPNIYMFEVSSPEQFKPKSKKSTYCRTIEPLVSRIFSYCRSYFQ